MKSSPTLHIRESLRSAPWPWAAGVALGVALLWVFTPTLTALAERWWNDARYSHGYLVPLFALYLLYARRSHLGGVASWRPSAWGVPLVAAGLALHAAGSVYFFDWFNAVALLPCLAGLVVLLGGWRALNWSWPAVAFLGFMVPLPFALESGLSQPLQRLGSIASCYVLQTMGFAAYREGNIVRMGDVKLEVVNACSGLSMLVIFFALSTAVAILLRRPLWERLLVVASAVPIALVSNVMRIVVTGVLHKTAGQEVAHAFHDQAAGFVMMPFALGLLWLELRALWWLVPTVPVEAGDAGVAGGMFARPGLGLGGPGRPA